MRVERLTSGEHAAWLSMRSTLWPDCLPEEHAREMAEILDDPDHQAIFLALDDENRPLGFVEASIKDWGWITPMATRPFGYIEGWYVVPEARRHGIGRVLIEAAEAWARSRGCREMGSDTEVENTVSQAAHQRLGYTVVERLVHFHKTLDTP